MICHETNHLIVIFRYFGTQKRTNYLFDESSGNSTDFRYYNYRRVPYMGGSDDLK